MIEFRPKAWHNLPIAVLMAGSLAACQQQAAESAESAAPQAEAGAPASPATSSPEAPGNAAATIAAQGGETGEAGVKDLYAGLDRSTSRLLRTQHFKGFLLVAQRVAAANMPNEASILVEQGLLEVVRPGSEDFLPGDVALFVTAGKKLEQPTPDASALGDAITALSVAQSKSSVPVDAKLVRQMLQICAGLYQGVYVDGGVDPIEYQHSLGAALSAQEAFNRARPALAKKDKKRTDAVAQGLERLISLWPDIVAPDVPTPNSQVVSQISRIELALSGLE